VAGPIAGRIGARTSFRVTLAGGAGLASAAFTFQAIAHSHPWHFIVSGMLLGAGISFALASMGNLIVDAVPQADVGIATGINTIMRTVGGAFGAAGAAAILAADRISGTPLPAESAYTIAFIAAAGSGLLALGAALLIPTQRAGGPGVGAAPAPAPARA
jgi:MFS family permease